MLLFGSGFEAIYLPSVQSIEYPPQSHWRECWYIDALRSRIAKEQNRKIVQHPCHLHRSLASSPKQL